MLSSLLSDYFSAFYRDPWYTLANITFRRFKPLIMNVWAHTDAALLMWAILRTSLGRVHMQKQTASATHDDLLLCHSPYITPRKIGWQINRHQKELWWICRVVAHRGNDWAETRSVWALWSKFFGFIFYMSSDTDDTTLGIICWTL